jgi:hypothetical protein
VAIPHSYTHTHTHTETPNLPGSQVVFHTGDVVHMGNVVPEGDMEEAEEKRVTIM